MKFFIILTSCLVSFTQSTTDTRVYSSFEEVIKSDVKCVLSDKIDEDFEVEPPEGFFDLKYDSTKDQSSEIIQPKYGNYPRTWLDKFSLSELQQSDVKAESNAAEVLEMMKFVWRNYRNTAWGKDEMNPFTGGAGYLE